MINTMKNAVEKSQGQAPNPLKIRQNKDRIRKMLKGSINQNFFQNSKFCQSELDDSQQTADHSGRKRGRSKTVDFGDIIHTSYPQIFFDGNQYFEDHYKLGDKLGQGAQSVVYHCYSKMTSESYAVKVTRTSSQEVVENIRSTFKMLQKLDHPNIVKVFDLFVDESKATVYMVMELCPYPDLRHLISTKTQKSIAQKMVRFIVRQLTQGIQFLHQKDICHRDIKPENILYDRKTQRVKIVDFEISKLKHVNQQVIEMWTDTGSLYYRAPQSFDGCYSSEVDIWAIGIVAYQLLTGKLPFIRALKDDTIKKIEECQIDFENLQISIIYQQLLKKTLQKDPSKRILASDILKLPCLNIIDQ